MQRPFVPITASFALGIVGACFVTLPISWLALTAAFLGLMGWRMPTRGRWFACGVLICLGAARYTQLTQLSGVADLRMVVSEAPIEAVLRGRIVVSPWLRLQERGGQQKARTLLILEAQEVRLHARWQQAEGQVIVFLEGELKNGPRTGALVEIEGTLSKPPGAMLDGLFDYQRYLAWQGIYFQLRAPPGAPLRLLADPTSRYRIRALADEFIPWAQRILALGLPGEDEALHLLWGMALGWKTALTSEVSEPYLKTGTLHVFAISGMHVALMSGMLVALLRVVRVPRYACGWIVIPWIWFYTAATGWQPSAIRSTIMMTVIVVGWMLKRPSDLVNSLAAAGFFILVWDARQLGAVGCQLSFLAVLSLALLVQPLQKGFHRWLRPDPLRAASTIPFWENWFWFALQALATALATSLAAWIGCLPLTLHYFHLASPVGLLANLLVVPLSSLALMCNLGAILTAEWLSWVTELLNHSAWLWMSLMSRFCRWCSSWPYGWFYVPAPPVWMMLIYLALLILLGLGWWEPSSRRRWIWGLSFGGIVGTALLVTVECRTSRLVLPALRGAFAVVVDQPGQHRDVVIDAGGSLDGEFTMVPYLRSLGYNSVPWLVLSHGDARHVGGVTYLLESMPIEHLLAPAATQRSSSLKSALRCAEEHGIKVASAIAGTEAGAWRVMFPADADKRSAGDDQPVVLVGDIQGRRVLIVPDLSPRGQSQLLESAQNLQADVLVASSPANGDPLGDRFLDAVRPRWVLFQDLDGRISTETIRRLKGRLARRGIQSRFASEDGSITMKFCWGWVRL